MQKRPLGKSDMNFTTIGLGTWAMGGADWDFGWGPQDDKKSIDTIHKALDMGINWIDTAPVYGLGHSEAIVGSALKGMSEKPYIATKLGRVWNEKKELGFDLSPSSIRKEIKDSLRRLQVEVIDLYQIHWPRDKDDVERAWETMAELVHEEKVRYLGICNASVEQLQSISRIYPVTSLQPPYSLVKPDVENELLPYCQENQIGVVPYSPMYKGLLTGKFSHEYMQNLPESDHRHRDPQFQDPQLDQNLKMVDQLTEIASRSGYKVAQLAIAWTLKNPAVTSAIVGARKPEQLDDIVPAGDWELSDEEKTEIDRIKAKHS
jgi:aryl-alcohol dehydrogenase-like predicted oxidoreductase